MSWVRFSDTWIERGQVEEAGAEVVALHLAALSWCARQIIDAEREGYVPTPRALRLWPPRDGSTPQQVIERAVAAGLWQPVEGGYVITGHLDHLEPAERVRTRREAGAERQRRYRDRLELHNRGDHSLCDPGRCHALLARNAVTDASTNAVSDSPSTRPVPTRPDPTHREGRREGGTTAAAAPGGASAASALPRAQDRPAPPFHAVPVVVMDEGSDSEESE